jgi:hypothetical protein
MGIRLLKESCLNRLKLTIPENLDSYGNEHSWTVAYEESPQESFESTVELSEEFLLIEPDESSLYDFENSIALHEALNGLEPYFAADGRLWGSLCHGRFWRYMRKRWPVAGEDRNEPFVREHYFVLANSDRWLIRNGIGRLWWYAYLTHDTTRADPYELTRVLLSKLDIARGLLERSWGSNRVILNAFLEFLQANSLSRDTCRALFRAITFLGGVTILDLLTGDDIKAYLLEILRYIRSSSKSGTVTQSAVQPAQSATS